jgi:hypothetical protein
MTTSTTTNSNNPLERTTLHDLLARGRTPIAYSNDSIDNLLNFCGLRASKRL